MSITKMKDITFEVINDVCPWYQVEPAKVFYDIEVSKLNSYNEIEAFDNYFLQALLVEYFEGVYE